MLSHWRSFLVSGLLLATCGCNSSDDDDGIDPVFRARDTSYATFSTTLIRVAGPLFAYLADEATSGEDLNGDLDQVDAVASLVDIIDRSEELAGIAALDIALLDTTLFLAVREDQDGRDWDADGSMDPSELSLVYWRAGMSQGEFVTRLDADSPRSLATADGQRLFIVQEEAPGAAGSTNIAVVLPAAPTVLLPVTTDAGGANGIAAALHGADEGLLILTVDEAQAGDLNGDMDGTDPGVLALIDGTRSDGPLVSTGYAVPADGPVLRALAQGTGDWLIGFLVDEAQQEEPTLGLGFNNRDLFGPTWMPDGCPGATDEDSADLVLHFFDYADWLADPLMRPIRNTGLVGRDRVVAVEGFVGTVSDEADDGPCDFNADGDTDDRVLRWVEAALDPGVPLLPDGSIANLLALATGSLLAGPTQGVAELEGRFVILVDEEADSRNHDLDLDNMETLLAWLDPEAGGAWDFDHGTTDPVFASASWMGESPERERLLFAGREEVFGENLNVPSGASGPDMDMDDSVPVLSEFDEVENRMTLPFVRIALDADNAGMVLADGVVFSRFDEAADSRDWNGDGDRQDHVLFGTLLTGSDPNVHIAGLANIQGRPAVDYDLFADEAEGAAFLASEAADREDYNHDGDETDLVVRYFRF